MTPGYRRSGNAYDRLVTSFVDESNRIEGIHRKPTLDEVQAHARFLVLQTVTVADMELFVSVVAGKPLRRKPGMDVRVGRHVPPPGGPGIEATLKALLAVAHTRTDSAYEVHQQYEHLHPFMDGNGRSGRVLWAWQMLREGNDPFALPFLHRWYYQSLDEAR